MNAPQPITSANGPKISLTEILERNNAMREMPVRITLTDYAVAVDKLIKLAQKDCGGSKSAAQVVLGLFNGHNWHVNLIDLCNLDCEYYRAAMIAIRGRVEFGKEPHELIKDGDLVFDQLQDQWQHLHTKNRYKNF
jgi:hypothetical protein